MVETALKQKAIKYIEQLNDEQTMRVIAYMETFPKDGVSLQNSKTPEERKVAAAAFADLETLTNSKNFATSGASLNGRDEWMAAFWNKYENLG